MCPTEMAFETFGTIVHLRRQTSRRLLAALVIVSLSKDESQFIVSFSVSFHFSETHRAWNFCWLISPRGIGLKNHKQPTLKWFPSSGCTHTSDYIRIMASWYLGLPETWRQGRPEALNFSLCMHQNGGSGFSEVTGSHNSLWYSTAISKPLGAYLKHPNGKSAKKWGSLANWKLIAA